jgi:hypothetical protein
MIEDPQGVHLANALLELVDALKDSQKIVYLVGPVQVPGFNLPGELSRKLRFGQFSEAFAMEALELPRNSFDKRFGVLIGTLSQQLGSNFLRPDTELCNSESCFLGDAGGSFFADSNHLGQYGIDRIRPIFGVVQLGNRP